MAYAIGLAILGASYWLGGWYWCLIYAAVICLQWRVGVDRFPYYRWEPLAFIAVFAISADRRMFFPFALYQAVVFGGMWPGGMAAGSALIIALFTLIRVEQEASFRVIAVELVVAVVAAFAGAAVAKRYSISGGAWAAAAVALIGLLL